MMTDLLIIAVIVAVFAALVLASQAWMARCIGGRHGDDDDD